MKSEIIATYKFGWYELDHPLKLNEKDDFFFTKDPKYPEL